MRLPKLSRKRRWKIALLVGAVFISIFFMLFTNYLVRELSKEEIGKVKKLAAAFEALNKSLENYEEHRLAISSDSTTRILIVDDKDSIRLVKNFSPTQQTDTAYLRDRFFWMKMLTTPVPLHFSEKETWRVYYQEKDIITYLRFYPYVQLLLIALYLGVAYVAFNTSRQFEQNRVWVGMAKETAHQIGTPLSSLMAWVDYMRTTEEPPGEEVLTEMEKDLHRLTIITERFSKIGSTPELQEHNLAEVLLESTEYLKRRISKKVSVSILPGSEETAPALINKNLFGWVIENLTKNAVDAMSGVGEISYSLKKQKEYYVIDVKDTGKGIPRANFKTVFEPGYTTRQRGWGLGLSLSKRIIENYHRGEIFVKESEPGKGTTFRIKLRTPDFQKAKKLKG